MTGITTPASIPFWAPLQCLAAAHSEAATIRSLPFGPEAVIRAQSRLRRSEGQRMDGDLMTG